MTRQSKTLIIVIAVVIVGAIGVILWTVTDRGSPAESSRESPGAPQQFDTTGGQEMRPRWGQQEGAAHDEPQD